MRLELAGFLDAAGEHQRDACVARHGATKSPAARLDIFRKESLAEAGIDAPEREPLVPAATSLLLRLLERPEEYEPPAPSGSSSLAGDSQGTSMA